MLKGMHIVWILAGLLALGGALGAAAQEAESCLFAPAVDAPLYAAPVFDVTQQVGVVRAGVSYAVTLQAPDYVYIQLDHAYGGYVARSQGALSGACGMNIPVDSAPIQSHPTLCVLVTFDAPVAVYGEPALLTQTDSLLPNAAYAVIRQSATGYYVYLGPNSGGWVSAGAGAVSGNCAALPSEPPASTATARANARVWSAPDVHSGTVLATLTPGSAVTITAGPVRGPISYSSDVQGDWYQISQGDLTGWVWSERLSPSAPPPAYQRAVALENARVWSYPDVQQGAVVAALAPGAALDIVAGPVAGPIRYDTPAVGQWYQVSQGGSVLGWVWSGRLSFTE